MKLQTFKWRVTTKINYWLNINYAKFKKIAESSENNTLNQFEI